MYGYRKNAAGTDAAADSLLNLSQSVKGTDTGAKDTAELVARIAKQISDANPDMAKALINCVPAADKNAEEWKKDLKDTTITFLLIQMKI